MDWPTKTHCDNTPRPPLGNPASPVLVFYRSAPMSPRELAIFCHPPAPSAPPITQAEYR